MKDDKAYANLLKSGGLPAEVVEGLLRKYAEEIAATGDDESFEAWLKKGLRSVTVACGPKQKRSS
jgi:peptidyl-tRNA hydrolase